MRLLYECGICSCYHRWGFRGDCRNDTERYASPEDYATRRHVGIYSIEIRTWEERMYADGEMAQ